MCACALSSRVDGDGCLRDVGTLVPVDVVFVTFISVGMQVCARVRCHNVWMVIGCVHDVGKLVPIDDHCLKCSHRESCDSFSLPQWFVKDASSLPRGCVQKPCGGMTQQSQ